jgi:ABC-type sugar transport system substrate-binding protein
MKAGVEAWAKENNVLVDVYAVESEENIPGQPNQLEDLVRKTMLVSVWLLLPRLI